MNYLPFIPFILMKSEFIGKQNQATDTTTMN